MYIQETQSNQKANTETDWGHYTVLHLKFTQQQMTKVFQTIHQHILHAGIYMNMKQGCNTTTPSCSSKRMTTEVPLKKHRNL